MPDSPSQRLSPHASSFATLSVIPRIFAPKTQAMTEYAAQKDPTPQKRKTQAKQK
jgi:hypothetical protein